MFRVASYTNQGGRDHNEDSVEVSACKERQCLVVADGLGGHGGGEIASREAVQILMREFTRCSSPDRDWVENVFADANREVMKRQTENCKMKTTCVSLFVEGSRAVWAHLGDSRLYHFVNGQLDFCTSDHSVSQMAVLSGEITRDQIRFHEDRNRVLKAFGITDQVKPDITEIPDLGKDFHAFLLCSDGFWEYVLEGEMEIDLEKTDSPGVWIQYMCERLRKRVGEKHDNYTAAAMFYAEGRTVI